MRAYKYRPLAWVLALLLVAGALPTQALAGSHTHANTVHPYEEAHFVLDEHTGLGYVDNVLVLFLKPGVAERSVLGWFAGENARIVGRFPGLHQVQVRIKPRSKAQLEALAQALMQRDQVLFAHPELANSLAAPQSAAPVAAAQPSPQDEYAPPAPSQRKPHNEWWWQVIGLQKAQQLWQGRDSIQVGVVDDGFDTLHPDLRLRFVGRAQEQDNLAEFHGTHVAGIVQQMMPVTAITVTDSYPVEGMQAHAHLGTLCRYAKYMMDMVEAGVRVLNFSMGMDLQEDALLPWHRSTRASCLCTCMRL